MLFRQHNQHGGSERLRGNASFVGVPMADAGLADMVGEKVSDKDVSSLREPLEDARWGREEEDVRFAS